MLKLSDVSKKYNENYALRSVNLNIEAGKLYLFVGDNGSGKSTVIKIISRVIFKSGKNGAIDNDFKRIIYLPDFCNYPNLLLVKTYLMLYLNNQASEKAIVEKMQQYHLQNKYIKNLSKGMKQKLGILQVLLSDGDLYIFDEPQDGLDKESCEIFKNDIKELIDNGKTVIISTHLKGLFKELKPIMVNFKEGEVNVKKTTKNT